MFEQTFKNIDDVLWKEAGCSSELDYTEQTSWILFLKYLDDLEQERAAAAELRGKPYDYLLEEQYQWSSWAVPKKGDGSLDHDTALTGDDLIDFVNKKLFPYLQGFRQRASGPDTIEYKVGEIFGEIKNKFQSGYSLREALDLMDALRFRSQKEKHELSHLYEAKIRNMGNAGRNGGEYYTPRPLIRAMVRVVAPKIGERIYDGACGSAGFLCEAHDYLRYGSSGNAPGNANLPIGSPAPPPTGNANLPIGRPGTSAPGNANLQIGRPGTSAPGNANLPIGRPGTSAPGNANLPIGSSKGKKKAKNANQEIGVPKDVPNDVPRLTTSQLRKLQSNTFYGKEKKSLAYVIAIMNMILHGIDAPNILHTNTLSENIMDIQEKDRFDVVLANPPFGGKERKEVQQNFPIKTSETAFLFLQHFIKSLKAGGRAAVVIKNTFLSNSDNASRALRRELLENCNLHTILDCPGGTFLGAGVKTVVLFFEKGAPTRKIWYYQLDPGRSLGKTNPLNDDDLEEFVAFQAKAKKSPKSWTVKAADVDQATFDLSVKNPNTPEEAPLRDPADIIDEIAALDAEAAEVLKGIRGML